MNFDHRDKTKELIARVEKFMDENVYPNGSSVYYKDCIILIAKMYNIEDSNINDIFVNKMCNEYGLEVNMDNFEERLDYMIEYFEKFKKKMKFYPYTSVAMCKEYLKLFNRLTKN